MSRLSKRTNKPPRAGNLRSRFVDEFMIDRNATEAAIRAGYSKNSAGQIGCRLLKDGKILTEINKRSEEQSIRLQITSDRIIQEYENLALFDPLDLFDDDGNLKALKDIPEHARRAISGLDLIQLKTITTDDVKIEAILKKLKFADKKGALDSLAKIKGMMKDKVEVTGQITIGALLGIVKAGER